MTREEAIRILDPATTMEALAKIDYYAGFEGHDAQLAAVDEASRIAVAALREQQEAQQNEPLTVAQMREMDGEKIHVHYINGFYSDENGAYFGKFEQLVRDCEGKLTACALPLGYYGKDWIAYRHKPKEG